MMLFTDDTTVTLSKELTEVAMGFFGTGSLFFLAAAEIGLAAMTYPRVAYATRLAALT